MDTYFLPIQVGGIKPKLAILNPLSKLLSWTLVSFSRLSLSKRQFIPRYSKERLTFDKIRYKWFGQDYSRIEDEDVKVYYKVQDHDGIKTAFVLDVYPISKYAINKAIRTIYKIEKEKVSLIMYVGYLPFSPLSLIKMPYKWEPKHFHFTCKQLVKGYFDDSIYDITNWSVNLSNYDLL